MNAHARRRHSSFVRESPAPRDVTYRLPWQDHRVHAPWQQTACDDRQVKPEGPRRVEAIRREALEIVADEEAFQVRAAVLKRHRTVPGKSDQRESSNRGCDVSWTDLPQSLFVPPDWYQHNRRDYERERPLHQESKTNDGAGDEWFVIEGPQMASVTRNAKGRSGSARRAIAKHPKQVATIAAASQAVSLRKPTPS